MEAARMLATTFFFSHKDHQGVAVVIPTIAYQLALAFPHIRGDIVRAIKTDKMLLSPAKSCRVQVGELVINLLGTLKERLASLRQVFHCIGEWYALTKRRIEVDQEPVGHSGRLAYF
jgi:hypothetical protein